MASPAVTAQTTKLAYSDGGSPSSFTDIPGVTRITNLGGGQPRVNDISDLDSTAAEKLLGLIDEGAVSVGLNVNRNNSVHQALWTARAAKTRLEWRVTYSNSKIAQFYGYVTQMPDEINTGDAQRGSMTIEVDGIVTRN